MDPYPNPCDLISPGVSNSFMMGTLQSLKAEISHSVLVYIRCKLLSYLFVNLKRFCQVTLITDIAGCCGSVCGNTRGLRSRSHGACDVKLRLFSTFQAASAVSAGAHGACDVESTFVFDISVCFGGVCGNTRGL